MGNDIIMPAGGLWCIAIIVEKKRRKKKKEKEKRLKRGEEGGGGGRRWGGGGGFPFYPLFVFYGKFLRCYAFFPSSPCLS